MTYEEAISIVRRWVRSRGAYTDRATWQTNNEAAKLAIEAMEKQVPKKPIGSFDDETYGKAYVCECTGVIDEYQRFCPHCGQALLWEDTE